MNKLKGTGVALITPFNTDGSVDLEGLATLVNYQISGGTNYLVVLGTTGETATLSVEEKDAVLAKVKEVNDGRVPLVVGIGGNNTAALVQEFKRVNLEGVSAILSASPYYNKPTQEGIYQHYKMLSEHSPLPIILYNVPGRTASNITAATTVRLAKEFNNIIGVKEASADLNQVMEIIRTKPADFMVISGEDGLTYPILTCGGVGVISVVANALPTPFSSMVAACLEGNYEKAKVIHYLLMPFIDSLFKEGNPGGIKAAAKALNICGDTLRLPLVNVSDALNESISKEVNLLNK